MLSYTAIWAIVIRHVRMWRRDPNLLISGFCWPLLDITIWGFLGAWIQQTANFQNYEVTALLGILLWMVVGRGFNVMVSCFTEELLSNNVVNLFSLPLAMIEWMIGIILFTALMIFITSGFCMMCMFMLYDVSPWYIFSTYLFFWPPLFFSCICTGFACLQIIVLLGKRGMELGFAVGWFLMPFSGAYYPIEVLPAWGQMISAVLPMSYIFQGMRTYVMYKGDPTLYLIKGYILSMVYAIVAALLFMCCFKRSKQKGLARLAD